MISIKKTGWFSRSVFLISLLVIVTACTKSANEEELIGRAKVYLESGDINAATLELKNILRDNANNAEARYLLGTISLKLGDMKSAQKEMRRAKDAGWNEAAVQLGLADAMFRQGYFQKVLDDVPIKDSYPDAIEADLVGLWALSEQNLGKWEDAEQTIKTGDAIAGFSDSLWLLQSKIQLQIYNKDLPAAAQILAHALEVHPDSQDLWLIDAGLAEEKGELEKANESLQKVVDLDPANNITIWGRQARLMQGQLWLQQENFVKAKAAVAPVVKAYSSDPLANYLDALIAFKQGEYDLSEKRLRAVLQVLPEHQRSLLLFGALNYARGDFKQAMYYLEKASALQSEDIDTQTLLGKTYLKLGQYDDAENRLKFASSKMGDDAELLALLGIAKLKGGSEAGILELERAAASAPKDTTIRSELASAYMAAGETERAIKELESVLEGSDQQYKTEALLLLAYLKASKFDKALNLANKLSKQIPNEPLPHNLAGVAYEGKQDFSAARSSYNTALGMQPDNIMAMLGLARLDVHDGNVEKARKRYHSVLENHPDNAAAMVALAGLAAQDGQIEKTIELLEKARKADKNAIEPRLMLSAYYLKKGMANEALDYANEAIKIAPQNLVAMLAVGRAQASAGKPEAVQTLSRLSKKLPDSADVHYFLAEAKARSGDLAGSRQSLQRVLVLKPDHVLALRSLGKLELSEGKTEAALTISAKLISTQPKAAVGYLLKGDVLLAKGKPKDALQAYQSALTYATGGEVVIKISGVKRLLGDSAASYDVLNKWLEQHPEDQTVRFVLAISYLTDGKKDAAVSQYEAILKSQPDNAAVLNDLAWLYFERGQQGALEMAEKAYHLAPNNAAIQDTYGWILVQSGRIESGLIALEQAISNAPKSPDIRYHLAAALAKAGDKARAKQELNTILQTDKPFNERASAEALQRELH
jgi:putative PEP-CTERM system TPR-repeat lipoprotein